LRPDLSELQVKLARLKNEVNDFRGAIDHLEKAVLMDASNSTIMDELGHLYNKAGEFEKAVMLLKQFPEFDVNAQICLAKAYSQLGKSEEIQAKIKNEDWNDYVIIAKGNHIQHFINGVQTIDVIDEDAPRAAKSGIIALQVHVGPPMVVQFKNIRIKPLK